MHLENLPLYLGKTRLSTAVTEQECNIITNSLNFINNLVSLYLYFSSIYIFHQIVVRKMITWRLCTWCYRMECQSPTLDWQSFKQYDFVICFTLIFWQYLSMSKNNFYIWIIYLIKMRYHKVWILRSLSQIGHLCVLLPFFLFILHFQFFWIAIWLPYILFINTNNIYFFD